MSFTISRTVEQAFIEIEKLEYAFSYLTTIRALTLLSAQGLAIVKVTVLFPTSFYVAAAKKDYLVLVIQFYEAPS